MDFLSSFFGASEEDDVGGAVAVVCESVAGGASDVVVLAVLVLEDDDVVDEPSWRSRWRGMAGVVLPTVSVTIGALAVDACAGSDEVRTRGARGAEDDGVEEAIGAAEAGAPAGNVPAIVGDDGTAAPLPSGFGFVGSVKFDVVSTFVFVIGGVVPPAPSMVEVTPLADPS